MGRPTEKPISQRALQQTPCHHPFASPSCPPWPSPREPPPEDDAEVASFLAPAQTKAFVALSRAVFCVGPSKNEKVPKEFSWPKLVGGALPPKTSA